MRVDKTPLEAPDTLTVVLYNDAMTRCFGEPASHRTIHLKLTDEQRQALRLEWVGFECGQNVHEGISMCYLEGDAAERRSAMSYRTCQTCRWWEKLRSQRYCEPWPCMYCWDNPEHPNWEAKP